MVEVASIRLQSRKSSAQRSSSRRGTSPTSSTLATSVPKSLRELAHVQARVLHAGVVDVDEIHRHLRSILVGQQEAERAHAAYAAVALAHLARDPAGDDDVARDEDAVARDERTPRADGRRPEARVRFVGSEVGRSRPEAVRAHVREIASVRDRRRRRGTTGTPNSSAHQRANAAGFLGRLRPFGVRAAERDERHDVERAETRVFAGVADDRKAFRDRRGEPPRAVDGVARTGPGHA